MKYAIIANLQFSTPTLNSQMTQAIKDKIIDKFTGAILKPVWGEVVMAEGTSEDGKPSSNLTIRFDKEVDMNEVYNLIRDKMIKLPVLKGRISKHLCGHDEHSPCVDWGSFEK